MNPITNEQPLPLQPPRSSFSCDRHPDDNFTGFCPSCLSERLTILDQSATASSSSTTAVKPVVKAPSSSRSKATTETDRKKLKSTTISSLPELRRIKSFSASKNQGFGSFAAVIEPQRKSCDVRGRNTLWSLFSIDDENKCGDSSTQQRTLTSSGAFLEINKKDEGGYQAGKVNSDLEIRVYEEQEVGDLNDLENDIVEMEAEIDAIVDNLKSIKVRIDLDAHSQKPSLSNFWSATSVLSEKWQKWRRKQKKSVAGRNSVISSRTLPVKKPISRQCLETQSEIADYGFGRRSCDIDPRFSLDAGRVSFDDLRHSFDEPRASWDGYLTGRSFPRLPPMVEDVPVVKIPRTDMQIPVEDLANTDNIPGGSIQTRDYYLDSSSKRRKSLDRSNSIRKIAATAVAEIDNQKADTSAVSNAKVSPATIDYKHIHGRSKFHSIGGENELERDSNSNSHSSRNDGSETFNKEAKRSRWWSWKLWGFTNRQKATHSGEREENTESKDRFNRKLSRSNSSVSWRNSSYDMKKSNSVEGDEFVFERNRSARHSPKNGLLRIYLTPLRGSRRSGTRTRTTKSKLSSNSHSISSNMKSKKA